MKKLSFLSLLFSLLTINGFGAIVNSPSDIAPGVIRNSHIGSTAAIDPAKFSTIASGYVVASQGVGVAPGWDSSPYLIGPVGIGTTGPDRLLDVLDSTNPQLRLTQADSTAYTDFQTNSAGQLLVRPTGGTVDVSSLVTYATTKTFANTPYTASASDSTIIWNTTGGNCDQSLPAGIAGRFYQIVNSSGSNTVTITPDGAQTIANGATYVLGSGDSVTIAYDGVSNWAITGERRNVATSSHTGVLTSTDWSTFNNKLGSYSETSDFGDVTGRNAYADRTIYVRNVDPETDNTYNLGEGASIFANLHVGVGYIDEIVLGASTATDPIITKGTADPSVGGGFAAPIRSIYLRDNSGTGELWFKTGASNTAWGKVM